MLVNSSIIESTTSFAQKPEIGQFSLLRNCLIGKNVKIGNNCVIGSEPDDTKKRQAEFNVVIGDNVIIGDYVNITKGIEKNTIISDNVHIMSKSIISHDSFIDLNVVISLGCYLAGFVNVLSNTVVGMGSSIHQFTTIGSYCMIGGGSFICKDLPPYLKFIPNKKNKINLAALKKQNISPEDVLFPKVYCDKYLEWIKIRNHNRLVY